MASEYYTSANLTADLPVEVPVMILQECALLPGTKLPLFIFEPRYRSMLADVLRGNRMFCIGTTLPEGVDSDLSPAVHRYSTLGLVRSCVGNEDGTSHLVLQGLTTIKIIDWVESDTPTYPVARIIGAEPEVYNPSRISGQVEELTELLARLMPPPFIEADEWFGHLKQIQDSPDGLARFLGACWMHSWEEQQNFLAAPTVDERLQMLLEKSERDLSDENE